jgi:hypothetical protein
MSRGIWFCIASGILLLTGCASVVKTYGPTGRPEYFINCSGPFLNWGACYTKANQVCGHRAYRVVAQSRHDSIEYLPYAGPSRYPITLSESLARSTPIIVTTRELTVSCRTKVRNLPLRISALNVALLAGTYQGIVKNPPDRIAFIVKPNGSFVGHDSYGCHVVGHFSPRPGTRPLHVYADSYGKSGCLGVLTGNAQIERTPRGIFLSANVTNGSDNLSLLFRRTTTSY